jgi:hypothetical protein
MAATARAHELTKFCTPGTISKLKVGTPVSIADARYKWGEATVVSNAWPTLVVEWKRQKGGKSHVKQRYSLPYYNAKYVTSTLSPTEAFNVCLEILHLEQQMAGDPNICDSPVPSCPNSLELVHYVSAQAPPCPGVEPIPELGHYVSAHDVSLVPPCPGVEPIPGLLELARQSLLDLDSLLTPPDDAHMVSCGDSKGVVPKTPALTVGARVCAHWKEYCKEPGWYNGTVEAVGKKIKVIYDDDSFHFHTPAELRLSPIGRKSQRTREGHIVDKKRRRSSGNTCLPDALLYARDHNALRLEQACDAHVGPKAQR